MLAIGVIVFQSARTVFEERVLRSAIRTISARVKRFGVV